MWKYIIAIAALIYAFSYFMDVALNFRQKNPPEAIDNMTDEEIEDYFI